VTAIWCDVDDAALRANVRALRAAAGEALLGIVVKSDAYGHGLVDSARAFVDGGADWLVVHAHDEAARLRAGQIEAPILVCGPTWPDDADRAAAPGIRSIVYDEATIDCLAAAGRRAGRRVPVHIKVETGTNRQGVPAGAVVDFARRAATVVGIELEGLSTHFADVEEGDDHDFARAQLAVLDDVRAALAAAGLGLPMWHCASSAAALVLPVSRGTLVRIGIAAYGLWPSPPTREAGASSGTDLTLLPALSWRTRVGQVKELPSGASVGYGRTWTARGPRPRRLAVLPVGYYDGMPRSRSNTGHVLLRGHAAPVRGRICMNLMMVDVTAVEAASGSPVEAGESVTLIGREGDAVLSAEDLAGWSQTIHYEIVSRIHPSVPRYRTSHEERA
jgi:alanine racemase